MTTPPQAALTSPEHRLFLIADAHRQFDFFDASIRHDGGFHVLDWRGSPVSSPVQELHTTTRLVHSYALGKLAGRAGCERMIEHGLHYLETHHRDTQHGGYVWALAGDGVHDGRKLAYGHVFVLLAAASAVAAGHPDANAMLEDVTRVLDTHFWEEEHGLFCDEWNRDWTPFSTYRGMNANMHGVEALLAAYEATRSEIYLIRAGRILDFFIGRIAPDEGWRLPEHYTQDWSVDHGYSENPMFRPAGTTPGHSFELARLNLQYHELAGSLGADQIATSRNIAYRAIGDAWDGARGGFVYTLDFDGTPAITDRYWWPVTEAIGVLAAFLKVDPQDEDATWYARVWEFARETFVHADCGGWYPEVDDQGRPAEKQFIGKPDIYHSVQAALFPLTPGVAGAYRDLNGVLGA